MYSRSMDVVEALVEACIAARAAEDSHVPAREVLKRTLAEPGAFLRAIGEPKQAGIETLYRSDSLTVLNVVWGPLMMVPIHDHTVWAAIGVYTGREDNIFWRRLPPDSRVGLEAAGARTLGPGDVVPLGPDIVHSVANPMERLTGAIHVYGGDFFDAPRKEWDAETLTERPLDMAGLKRRFADSNRRI
jgi:predicted metal-dependent enzyme (double-stranded beta helix superfamily)